MTKPQLFTVEPDPPVKGEDFTVAYAFPSGVSSVNITVAFEPGGSTPHTLNAGDGPLTLTSPDDADSILVTDESETSKPYHKGLANP